MLYHICLVRNVFKLRTHAVLNWQLSKITAIMAMLEICYTNTSNHNIRLKQFFTMKSNKQGE